MISVSHFMWHSVWHLFSWMTRWLAFHGREVKVCWCIGCFAWSSWGTPEFGCRGPKPSTCWGVFTLTLLMLLDIFWCDFSESQQLILKFCEEKALLILIALKDAAAAAQLCADKITALPNDATVPWLPPELHWTSGTQPLLVWGILFFSIPECQVPQKLGGLLSMSVATYCLHSDNLTGTNIATTV